MPGGLNLPSSSHTVLVVEDNADHALLVRLAAQRVDSRLDVQVVSDGVEAVAYLEGREPYEDRDVHPFPDLVILDLIMPRLDGFGVLSWIRERSALDRLPVVVLTSSISPQDEARAMRLGATSFQTKPADLDRLQAQVGDIVTQWLD